MPDTPPSLSIEGTLLTHPGQTRDHNEDFVGFYAPTDPDELARLGCLYVVCDGVGGAAAGEIASRHTVETVLYDYFNASDGGPRARLELAIQRANADIFQFIQERGGGRRMATTCVAAVIRDNRALIANVGDSRAYLIRHAEVQQITRDHSLVQQLVREGNLTEAEARVHPKKNVLSRALGNDDTVVVDFFDVPLASGDQLLLCTDGFARYALDSDIGGLSQGPTAAHAAGQMIAHANQAGGADNISVCLLRFHAAAPAPRARRAAPVAEPLDLDVLEQTARDVPAARAARRAAPAGETIVLRLERNTLFLLVTLGAVGVIALAVGSGLLISSNQRLRAAAATQTAAASLFASASPSPTASPAPSASPSPSATLSPTVTAVPPTDTPAPPAGPVLDFAALTPLADGRLWCAYVVTAPGDTQAAREQTLGTGERQWHRLPGFEPAPRDEWQLNSAYAFERQPTESCPAETIPIPASTPPGTEALPATPTPTPGG